MAWLFIMLLLCMCKNASSIHFIATPDRVVLGDSRTLTMACFVTDNDVLQVYNIKIKRAIAPGSTTDELVASFVSGTATLDDGIKDDKGYTVAGDLNGALSRRLEVSMDISKLICSDGRMYECEIGYDSRKTGKIELFRSTLTLQTLVLPEMLPPLQARRNGQFVEGGTRSDRVVFEFGDQLELQCRANIGSIDKTTIRWRKTSEKDSSQFIDYEPPEGSYDEGVPLNDNQCGYVRTATIRYDVKTPVAENYLAFECYVSVSGYPSSILTPSGVFTATDTLRYHVEILSTHTAAAASRCFTGCYFVIAGVVIGLLTAILTAAICIVLKKKPARIKPEPIQ